MYFLNLMLNAFSSLIRANQIIGDAGPSPAGALAPFVPIPPLAGPLAAGYPYPAMAAGINPNNGFSNFSLMSEPAVIHGGVEIWYQMQIANFLQYYLRTEAAAAGAAVPPPFFYQREAPMPHLENVDFFLAKTNAGVLYNGYYEIKVQLDNNLNIRAFNLDILKIARYVQNGSVTLNAALPRAPLPINREYVCMLFLFRPNAIAGFNAVNLQNLIYFNGSQPNYPNFPYVGPYLGNAPPAGFPIAYPIPAAPNVPNIARYPAAPVAGYVPFPNGANQPPGIVHFFQPIVAAGPPVTYTFQEVAAAAVNPNNPLLCVYNGN